MIYFGIVIKHKKKILLILFILANVIFLTVLIICFTKTILKRISRQELWSSLSARSVSLQHQCEPGGIVNPLKQGEQTQGSRRRQRYTIIGTRTHHNFISLFHAPKTLPWSAWQRRENLQPQKCLSPAVSLFL